MLERFLKQTHFVSEEDYRQHLEFIIPRNFNFAYDVMDVWAEEAPEKLALLWTNDHDEEHRYTFADLKRLTDQAASYYATLGIGRGDMVMLILKRRIEWWISILALHKLGAIAIPATHMLTKHDIIYRNNAASVKAIICVDDPYVTGEIEKALPESPTVEQVIIVGTENGGTPPNPSRHATKSVAALHQTRRGTPPKRRWHATRLPLLSRRD
jgi:acetyl-CoA synthetase